MGDVRVSSGARRRGEAKFGAIAAPALICVSALALTWLAIGSASAAPSLDVSEPSPGATSLEDTIWIAGTTEPGARLAVSGQLVPVSANGSFQVAVPLLPGVNSILLAVTDEAGNSTSSLLNVTYADPASLLRAQIAMAQANLTAAQAELSETNAQIAQLEAAGNLTSAELASANAQLALDQTALSKAEADLDLVRLRIAALSETENATAASLAVANAQLAVAVAALQVANARIAALEADGNATAADLASAKANLSAAQSDLVLAQARIDELEPSGKTGGSAAEAEAAQREVVAATGFALVGIAVGVMGVAMAVRARRDAPPISTVEPSASGPQAAPGPQPSVIELALCPQCGQGVAIGSAQCAACGLGLAWG